MTCGVSQRRCEKRVEERSLQVNGEQQRCAHRSVAPPGLSSAPPLLSINLRRTFFHSLFAPPLRCSAATLKHRQQRATEVCRSVGPSLHRWGCLPHILRQCLSVAAEVRAEKRVEERSSLVDRATSRGTKDSPSGAAECRSGGAKREWKNVLRWPTQAIIEALLIPCCSLLSCDA